MKKEDATNASGLAGVLTVDELISKLDRVDRLMKIDGWTKEANDDYNNLFNVDKDLEKINSRRAQKQVWKPDHRLSLNLLGTRLVNIPCLRGTISMEVSLARIQSKNMMIARRLVISALRCYYRT